MLIVKVYVNEKQIDELRIKNLGRADSKGHMLYTIRKPEGLDHILIHHRREDGWQELVTKALAAIKKQKVKKRQ